MSQNTSTLVYLLTSGWAGDDQNEYGIFTTVDKAKAAAPSVTEWTEYVEPRRFITWEGEAPPPEGQFEPVPYWIETFELDHDYTPEMP